MEIRNKETGLVITGEEFNRNVCSLLITPEILEQYGYDPVFEGPQATTVPPYQYSQRAGVVNDNGFWYTKYVAGPIFTDIAATETEPAKTALEQETAYKLMKDTEQAKSIRTSRTALLRKCDWTQLIDSTANKDVWAVYRTALRNVPEQTGFPWTIEWPVDPDSVVV